MHSSLGANMDSIIAFVIGLIIALIGTIIIAKIGDEYAEQFPEGSKKYF